NHIANAINNIENQAELFLVFQIQLDNVALSGVSIGVKLIAKLIINKIEKEDGYNWTYVIEYRFTISYWLKDYIKYLFGYLQDFGLLINVL
ncbi:19818_t:CDS:1, partial [Dentiscutata erythropus]